MAKYFDIPERAPVQLIAVPDEPVETLEAKRAHLEQQMSRLTTRVISLRKEAKAIREELRPLLLEVDDVKRALEGIHLLTSGEVLDPSGNGGRR